MENTYSTPIPYRVTQAPLVLSATAMPSGFLIEDTAADAAQPSGSATVIDSDGLRIDGQIIRIRGIDAPETSQTYAAADGSAWPRGQTTRSRMSQLVAGREVRWRQTDRDQHGLVLAICEAEGIDVGQVLVTEGLAWAYRRYSSDHPVAENSARECGLCIGLLPIDPHENSGLETGSPSLLPKASRLPLALDAGSKATSRAAARGFTMFRARVISRRRGSTSAMASAGSAASPRGSTDRTSLEGRRSTGTCKIEGLILALHNLRYVRPDENRNQQQSERSTVSIYAKMDVMLKNDGQVIGHRPGSPVRKMPDGTAGIVVSGSVYPLYEDKSVDLGDEGVRKDECPQFHQLGDDLVFKAKEQPDDWSFFEARRSRSYVAFDGDEEFARRLHSAFKDEGFASSFDESFRPARNGRLYDYFIRLPSHVDAADVQHVLIRASSWRAVKNADHAAQEALGWAIEARGGPSKFLAFIADTWASKAQLETELERQRGDALEQHRRTSALEETLVAERKERNSLAWQVKALHAERDRMRAEEQATGAAAGEKDAIWEAMQAEEITRLQKELAEVKEERDWARLEVDDLKTSAIVARADAKAIEAKLEAQAAEARLTDLVSPPRIPSSRREKQFLNNLLSGAFPRLDFQDGDIRSLLTDFESISAVARVMSDLQEGRQPPHAKSFQGIPGVFEVSKIGTAIKRRETLGRLYFRKSPGEDRVEVAVHVKKGDGKQQEKFVSERFG
nr:thermonuclease family protein [Paracoccus saliphilus]